MSIVAVGDILLAEDMQPLLNSHGYDFPFKYLKELIPNYDILLGNLEGPITQHPFPIADTKEFVYKAEPDCASALKNFGFTILNLANNHILDFGVAGMLDTWCALDGVGITHFGSGKNLTEAAKGKILEIGGVTIGFLGFMQIWQGYLCSYPFYAEDNRPGVPMATDQLIRQSIDQLRSKVDILVANFHWGRNYADVRYQQIQLGRLAVDYGADLVIGHNAHNFQGMEIYRQVPILYGLGNFTFGTNGEFRQLPDTHWHHGWIAHILMKNGVAIQLDLIPISINNNHVRFQPRPTDPRMLPKILTLVNGRFGTSMDVIDHRAHWILNRQPSRDHA